MNAEQDRANRNKFGRGEISLGLKATCSLVPTGRCSPDACCDVMVVLACWSALVVS